MGDLAANLRRRVRQSRQQLQAASDAGDDYGISTFTADLDYLLGEAAEHGVAIDTDTDTDTDTSRPVE